MVPFKTEGHISLHLCSYLIQRNAGNIPVTVKLLFTYNAQIACDLTDSRSVRYSFLSCQQFHFCLDRQRCNVMLPSITSTQSKIQAALIFFFFFLVILKVARSIKLLSPLQKHCSLLTHWIGDETADILSLDQTLSIPDGVLFRKE